MEKKTIRDMDVRGKRVFVRVDFNVPLDGTTITDDTRIRAALPTIQELRAKGARIILASHLGRPKGKVDPALSLRPIGKRLEQLVGTPVIFSEESIGPVAQAHVEKLQPGDVLLLENVRFHPGEEKMIKISPPLLRLLQMYMSMMHLGLLIALMRLQKALPIYCLGLLGC